MGSVKKLKRRFHHKPKIFFIPWRFYFAIFIAAALIAALTSRIIYLSVIQQKFLRTEGDSRSIRVVDIPAFRGMILDRNHRPLAVSAQVYSIWVNPQQFSPTAQMWKALSRILDLNQQKATKQLLHHKNHGREFWYLRRGVAPNIAVAVKKLNISGLYLHSEQKRSYPEGDAIAHILGFTDVDDHGQEGIELWFNDWLQGISGKKLVVRDLVGNVIADIKTIQEPHPGKHLILSIDSRMQYIAYRELQSAVRENQAESGSVVVVYVPTGEILAMANYPSFDPNQRKKYIKYLRNSAVTDLFEPGSTIKAFSAVAALESKKFTPSTLIDTNPGWIKLGHNFIRDERNYGILTLAQIIQLSSDVGTTKAILSLPSDTLWALLQQVGFGEATGLEFPGEKLGVLNKPPDNSPFMQATLSFGYSMASTAVQLARSYTVFANHGVKLPLTLLKREHVPEGTIVLPPLIAQQTLGLLESVVANKRGTGYLARIPGYRIAGKTGTVRVVGEHGYDKNRHNAMFVGIAPVTHPLFVTLVIIRDSRRKNASGSSLAAPVFAKIMAPILRMLDVAPDNKLDLTNASTKF